jgi:hypothetical protein
MLFQVASLRHRGTILLPQQEDLHNTKCLGVEHQSFPVGQRSFVNKAVDHNHAPLSLENTRPFHCNH